jgi:hypothetical protein
LWLLAFRTVVCEWGFLQMEKVEKVFLIVHLTHSRPPPPIAGQLVAGRGIASCPSVAVNGGGTGESTGIAG